MFIITYEQILVYSINNTKTTATAIAYKTVVEPDCLKNETIILA